MCAPPSSLTKVRAGVELILNHDERVGLRIAAGHLDRAGDDDKEGVALLVLLDDVLALFVLFLHQRVDEHRLLRLAQPLEHLHPAKHLLVEVGAHELVQVAEKVNADIRDSTIQYKNKIRQGEQAVTDEKRAREEAEAEERKMRQQSAQLQEEASRLATLEALEHLINAAKTTSTDIKEANEAGLAPGRALRLRRKSKELEIKFASLASSSLESVFKSLDKDNSGTLEASELKEAFAQLGRPQTDEAIKAAIKALDSNNDGVIDLAEFKQIAWKINVQ